MWLVTNLNNCKTTLENKTKPVLTSNFRIICLITSTTIFMFFSTLMIQSPPSFQIKPLFPLQHRPLVFTPQITDQLWLTCSYHITAIYSGVRTNIESFYLHMCTRCWNHTLIFHLSTRWWSVLVITIRFKTTSSFFVSYLQSEIFHIYFRLK